MSYWVAGTIAVSAYANDRASSRSEDAINSSTDASVAMQNKGLEETIRQFGIGQENMAPFLSAGTDALGQVQQGSTVGGLDEALQGIFNSESFGALKDERMNSVMGSLGSTGLTRSGAGMEEIANVPTDLGMQLEQLLFNRQSGLATMGQNTAVGAGTSGANFANSVSNIYGNMADTAQSGALGAAQVNAQGTQNLLNTGALALDAYKTYKNK